ncbi:zona pellucida sperm-binding protein 3d.2 isoform X1 [Alosa alosa]|uniref:zona pellucida sperm-binding protein 3d.2 isoform X1 n=1 Tax=Alosa alosa TaxID=278164 RepID=UPI00201509C7|nr:zona pellucida sperm-binding protein 3d.2 isoform X1 [Alosa alosa]
MDVWPLPMYVIWSVILSSGSSKGHSGDSMPTANASASIGVELDAVHYRSGRQVQDQEAQLPLQLPMFQHSRVPLVAKDHFSPISGERHEKLPNNIKEILLPVSPPFKKSRHSGGPRGVVIKCKVNKMEVRVPKRLLGDVPAHSHLAFGTCQANNFTKHYLSFVYDVYECGSRRTIVNNRVAYSNTLRYAPVVTMGPIRRAIPFTLPITCHFNRFHYSYKIGYKPKVQAQTFFKYMTSRQTVYTLTPFDAHWRRLNASDGYAIGRPMFFEAEGPPVESDGRLYIHSCHITANKSLTSEPRFTVIDNFGCMADSKSSSESRFISYTRNTVRFSVDAFVFQGVTNKHLFMHCEMSVGGETPTVNDKSCSYNHKTKRWEELCGLDLVCSCCESTCISPPAATNRMVSSGAWSVESDVRGTNKMMPPLRTEQPRATVSPLWPEESAQEIMPPLLTEKRPRATVSPLWPEESAQEIMPPLLTEKRPRATVSPLWPEEDAWEMPPLWPEEEEREPENVQAVMVTERPITASIEEEKVRETEPRRIFEEIFGLN